MPFRISADGRYKFYVNGELVCFLTEEEGFSPLHIHEKASGDPDAAGWKNVDFDDRLWQEAGICADADIPTILRAGNLLPRPIPFMEQNHGLFTSWP
jgi:hypothetical protein